MPYIDMLPTQFDKPFNIVTSQCSWFSYHVIKNLQDIKKSLLDNDKELYKTLITKCLIDGTKDRKDNYEYELGENIDQVKYIKNLYNYKVCTVSDDLYNSFLSFAPEILVLKRDYEKINKENIKQLIINYAYNNLIVNKHGESFVITSVKNDEYIIIDSHKSKHLIGNINDIMDYVMDDYHGFYYILIGIPN